MFVNFIATAVNSKEDRAGQPHSKCKLRTSKHLVPNFQNLQNTEELVAAN